MNKFELTSGFEAKQIYVHMLINKKNSAENNILLMMKVFALF